MQRRAPSAYTGLSHAREPLPVALNTRGWKPGCLSIAAHPKDVAVVSRRDL